MKENNDTDTVIKYAEFTSGLNTNFKRMQEMARALGEDCQKHIKADMEEDDQTHRRAYVRSVFAFVEGLTFGMKQTAGWVGGHTKSLEITELVLLTEQSVDIKENGSVKIGYLHTRLVPNIRFAFRTFSKAFDSSFSPDFSKVGWESLKKAVEVRDRLTHPKSVEDLEVTREEMIMTNRAFNWFFMNHALCSVHNQKAVTKKLNPNTPTLDLDKRINELEQQLLENDH